MSEIPIRPVLEFYGWTLPPERIGWRTTKCYAHEDSHASARFTEDDGGSVFCNACDIKGDAIDVVKFYERLEFRDALARAEDIARSAGHDVPDRAGSGRRSADVPGGSRFQSRKRKYSPPRRRPA